MGFWSGLGKLLPAIGAIGAAPFTGGASLFGLAGLGTGAAAGLGTALGAGGGLLSAITGGAAGAGQAAGGAAKGRLSENEQRLVQERNRIDKYAAEQRAMLDKYTGEDRAAIDRGQLGLGADQNLLDAYATRQRAGLDALLGQERGAIDRGTLGVSQGNLDLAQRQFGLDAHGQLTDQALRADRLANAQPLVLSHPRATIPGMTGGYTPSAELRGGMAGALTDRLARLKAGEQFKEQVIPPPTDFASGVMQQPDLGFQMPEKTDWSGAIITPPEDMPLTEASGWENAGGIAGSIGGILGGIVNNWPKPTPQPPPITAVQPLPPYAMLPPPRYLRI